jgi:actin-related protein
MGAHECLVSAVMRTDMDLRRTLFSQIVLSGGSTCTPGFGDRLLNEVCAIYLLLLKLYTTTAGFDDDTVIIISSTGSTANASCYCRYYCYRSLHSCCC